MRPVLTAVTTMAAVSLLAVTPPSTGTVVSAAAALPRATLISAPEITLPGAVDSNSPVVWDLEDGQRKVFVLTSHSGVPSLSSGSEIARLGGTTEVSLEPYPGYGVWFEAVVSDDVDTWYGYYHNEWPATRCGREDRAVPRIGAAKSTDHGRTWTDLGPIIQAYQSATACESSNRYVIGGVGDVSVMVDREWKDVYLYYSNYERDPGAQGVLVARFPWADRDAPQGRVTVWQEDVWLPPTVRPLTGTDEVPIEWDYPSGTPIVRTTSPWHDGQTAANAFWGPSLHWNTSLQRYVMLLNRTRDESFTNEGIYISFAPTLDDPRAWSTPKKILSGGGWYPQVAGLESGSGTDREMGGRGRFLVTGRSTRFIEFR